MHEKYPIQIKQHIALHFVMCNYIRRKMFLKIFPISFSAAHYTVCMLSISKCIAVFLWVAWIILYMFLSKVIDNGKISYDRVLTLYSNFLNCFQYMTLLASRHLRIDGDQEDILKYWFSCADGLFDCKNHKT